MNDTDAIFFLETMKVGLMGSMQANLEKLNKFEATAINYMTMKNIEALDIGIKTIKGKEK